MRGTTLVLLMAVFAVLFSGCGLFRDSVQTGTGVIIDGVGAAVEEKLAGFGTEFVKKTKAWTKDQIKAGLDELNTASLSLAQKGFIWAMKGRGVNAMMHDFDGDGLLDDREMDSAEEEAQRKKREEDEKREDESKTIWQSIWGTVLVAASGAFGTWGKSALRVAKGKRVAEIATAVNGGAPPDPKKK
jgi:hypothetical protein